LFGLALCGQGIEVEAPREVSQSLDPEIVGQLALDALAKIVHPALHEFLNLSGGSNVGAKFDHSFLQNF
jgi:hypothetical protein